MKLLHFTLPAFFIIGITLLTSCKKSNNDGPQTALQHFEVDFGSAVIDINSVDSVIISLNNPLGGPVTTQKMQRTANGYSIDNASDNGQPVNAQIIVYTPKYNNVQGTKPVIIFVYNAANTKGFTVNGPSDIQKDAWKPRFIFSDDNKHVFLTVSEDQEDPYFSLKADHPQDWTLAHFQKAVYNASGQHIDDALWDAFSTDSIFPEGSDVIVNTINFIPYAARVANTNWAQGEIDFMLIQTDPAKYIAFHSMYNKRR